MPSHNATTHAPAPLPNYRPNRPAPGPNRRRRDPFSARGVPGFSHPSNAAS